jgi:hypothetical protein
VAADGGLVTRLLVALSAGRPEPAALVDTIEEAAIGERHVAYFLAWLREFLVARLAGDDAETELRIAAEHVRDRYRAEEAHGLAGPPSGDAG